MVSKHVVTAGGVFVAIGVLLSSCSGDTSPNCYFDPKTAEAVCTAVDGGLPPLDGTVVDVTGGCARFSFFTNGNNCSATGCSAFSCACPGGVPVSFTSCQGADGCISGANCTQVCAANLSEATSCTGTHTVLRNDAGGDSCIKTTCLSTGANCGTPPDGCGGTLASCGTCTAGPNTTCGGGGTPFVCGCTPGTQTVGPSLPATALDLSTLGTRAWTTPTNVSSMDGVTTDAALAQSEISHLLYASNYAFTVPSNATIQGIEVDVRRKSLNGVGIADQSVRIMKNGTALGTDRAVAGLWPNSLTTAAYGSSSDLWGTTWTPSDINNGAFGAAIAAVRSSASTDTASVDSIQIKVTYALTCP